MLSRDQVLHVARLARLELTDDEVERFGGELSKVLDYIELISELGDLGDVPPPLAPRPARPELTDDEVERFGGELSKGPAYIELISELGDLGDVPPTSHVVDVENALRADEPRPSMPVEKALESAPDAGLGG